MSRPRHGDYRDSLDWQVNQWVAKRQQKRADKRRARWKLKADEWKKAEAERKAFAERVRAGQLTAWEYFHWVIWLGFLAVLALGIVFVIGWAVFNIGSAIL